MEKNKEEIINKNANKKRGLSFIFVQTFKTCNVLERPIPGAKP